VKRLGLVMKIYIKETGDICRVLNSKVTQELK
jgi:hypothetical protein